MDSANSVRRCFQSRTVPGMSASDSDAAITTAASVGWGRSRNRPGKNRSIAAISIAPTRPVTCVFRTGLLGHGRPRPARADREPLEEPGAEVRDPDPDHLPVAVDLLTDRAANADDVEMVSASETSAIPNAPADQREQVGAGARPGCERREPFGSVPTSVDTVLRELEARGDGDRRRPRRRARRAPRGSQRCRTTITARPSRPTASAAPTVLPSATPSHERPAPRR